MKELSIVNEENEEVEFVDVDGEQYEESYSPIGDAVHGLGQAVKAFFYILVVVVFLGSLKGLCRYYLHRPARGIFDLVFVSLFVVVFVMSVELYRERNEAMITDRVIETIAAGSQLTRDIDLSKMTGDNAIREFMNAGAPKWLQEAAVRIIIAVNTREDMPSEDVAVQIAIYEVESGFNPLAKAPTTSACGLGQFVSKTGKSFGLSASDCMAPGSNALAQVEHYRELSKKWIVPAVSGIVDPTERLVQRFKLSYCLHHDGETAFAKRGCSKVALATVSRGLNMLFLSHKALEQAEADRRSTSPKFAASALGVASKMVQQTVDSFSGIGDFFREITGQDLLLEELEG